MLIGLCGSHRVGKTTLAKAFAQDTGAKFLETSISAWGREIHLDSSSSHLTFEDRMTLQEHLLKRLNETLALYVNQDCVADRTPLDLLLYTMINVQAETVSPEQYDRLNRYIQACFDSANQYFLTIVALQPGIPLIDAEGKGAANAAYVEHLNTLSIGFVNDERLKIPRYYIPREILSIARRMSALRNAVSSALQFAPYLPKQSIQSDPFVTLTTTVS